MDSILTLLTIFTILMYPFSYGFFPQIIRISLMDSLSQTPDSRLSYDNVSGFLHWTISAIQIIILMILLVCPDSIPKTFHHIFCTVWKGVFNYGFHFHCTLLACILRILSLHISIHFNTVIRIYTGSFVSVFSI